MKDNSNLILKKYRNYKNLRIKEENYLKEIMIKVEYNLKLINHNEMENFVGRNFREILLSIQNETNLIKNKFIKIDQEKEVLL